MGAEDFVSGSDSSIPTKIAKLVEEKGWNQDAFARIARLNRHTVRQILRGGDEQKHQNQTVQKCARALGLTVSELRDLPLDRLLLRVHTESDAVEVKPDELTIAQAQRHQPWTVPYSDGVLAAADADVPHILASHAVLHAAKSVGKLAAVFERLDHRNGNATRGDADDVAAMSADLVTAALRLANLYAFDLATVLVERVREKNGVDVLQVAAAAESQGG